MLMFISNLGECAFITMSTEPRGFLAGDQVSLYVETTNAGDERALNVRIEALFLGAPQSSKVLGGLEPNSKTDHAFEWRMPEGLKYRQMVVPVLTHYTDANHYRFSCVTCAVALRETPAVVGFAGRMDSAIVADKGSLRLQLMSTDGKAHKVKLRFVAPREISAEAADAEVSIPASGSIESVFRIRNFSALPGSSYVVWVVLSEDGAEGIVEDAVMGNVRIDTKRNVLVAQWRWGIASLAAILALLYLYHVVSVRKKQ
jgi:hypothetical protein